MTIKIGELAKRTGAKVETIRYYEKERLLPSLFVAKGIIVYIMKSTLSVYNLSYIAVRSIWL